MGSTYVSKSSTSIFAARFSRFSVDLRTASTFAFISSSSSTIYAEEVGYNTKKDESN